jgi:hypothetical protein
MSAAIEEHARLEQEKLMIDKKWNDEIILTSPPGVTAHDRAVMDRYIENSRTLEKAICMRDHCKRMIAIKAKGE